VPSENPLNQSAGSENAVVRVRGDEDGARRRRDADCTDRSRGQTGIVSRPRGEREKASEADRDAEELDARLYVGRQINFVTSARLTTTP